MWKFQIFFETAVKDIKYIQEELKNTLNLEYSFISVPVSYLIT